MEKTLKLYLNRKNNVELFLKFHLNKDKIYDLIGDFDSQEMSKELLQETIIRLHKKEYGWNHPIFSDAKLIIEEENDALLNPFKIEEGVLQCNHCGSKRTYSFEKQTRSADEGTTTFAQCADCLKSWCHYN